MSDPRLTIWQRLWPMLAVIGIASIGGFMIFETASSMAPARGTRSENNGPSAAAVQVMAEEFVREHLKAPSTAEFATFATVRGDEERCRYSVIGTVDAENSFGAKLRSEYIVTMKLRCRDNYLDDACWQLRGLSVGEQVIIAAPVEPSRCDWR